MLQTVLLLLKLFFFTVARHMQVFKVRITKIEESEKEQYPKTVAVLKYNTKMCLRGVHSLVNALIFLSLFLPKPQSHFFVRLQMFSFFACWSLG